MPYAKRKEKVLCMDAQRHAEYYGMQRTFDELHAKAKPVKHSPA